MIKILKNNIFNDKNKKYSLLIIILLVLIITVNIFKYINYDNKGITINRIKILENLAKDEISVYIDGEVNRIGYIKIFKGATIEDAITKAEGITEYADIEHIDLARVLKDKEKIVIPTIRDNVEDGLKINKQEDSRKVNINTASIKELTQLDGIGEKTANRIIEYRENNKFNNVEEITQIKGIGKAKFEKIKDYICV